ncbi:hypothetical protein PRZ48_013351 [Zasmidium cellare]|uniref:Uncharacterized protein n=1 Tax=Zasmidium cellare TaxID=395010 RepID=A0ABR0E0T2_ZASCE|nr:hypothetical protein PRZ48_013351 [Zasmidium cellare]
MPGQLLFVDRVWSNHGTTFAKAEDQFGTQLTTLANSASSQYSSYAVPRIMPQWPSAQSHMPEDGDDDGFSSTEKLIKNIENEDAPNRNRTQSRQRWRTVAIHGAAILLYGLIAVIFTAYLNRSSHRGQYLIYSPANEAVKYETRVYNPSLIGDPEYFGPPSPEIDSKWSELMWPSSIHIAEEERQHYDHKMPIVQFPDGTYSGQLMVYKRLYQYINADYYFPNLTQKELEMNKMHTGLSSGQKTIQR